MNKKVVKIGFVPTKRVNFNHPRAFEIRDEIREAVGKWDMDGIVELVDIDDVTAQNILQSEVEAQRVADKFIQEKVDGIFVPHCNFGCEGAVAGLARRLNVPVLLWGPRDEDPSVSGIDKGLGRNRDSQCGLFATSKALRRSNVKFTYIPNTPIDDPTFERGFKSFAAVCAAVRDFKQTRILQVGTRPEPFWTMMINEGELVEKFDVHVLPIAMNDLVAVADRYRKEGGEILDKTIAMITDNARPVDLSEEQLKRLAAYYLSVVEMTEKYNCNALALFCWAPFRSAIGVAACGLNGYLAEFAGIPVGCETDVNGVLTSRLLHAATLYSNKILFADLTIRHPYNDNSELLWHCGNFPVSAAGTDCTICDEGRTYFECKIDEPLTICRFDGDHGEYSMLIGEGKTVQGPRTTGTYSWVEVNDWVEWEDKIINGPYVHHSACAYGHYAPIVYEACKYLNIKPDLCDPDEKAIKNFWYGR